MQTLALTFKQRERSTHFICITYRRISVLIWNKQCCVRKLRRFLLFACTFCHTCNRQVRFSKDTPWTETNFLYLFPRGEAPLIPIWAEPAKPFTKYTLSKFVLFSLYFLSPFFSFCNTCWNHYNLYVFYWNLEHY